MDHPAPFEFLPELDYFIWSLGHMTVKLALKLRIFMVSRMRELHAIQNSQEAGTIMQVLKARPCTYIGQIWIANFQGLFKFIQGL